MKKKKKETIFCFDAVYIIFVLFPTRTGDALRKCDEYGSSSSSSSALRLTGSCKEVEAPTGTHQKKKAERRSKSLSAGE